MQVRRKKRTKMRLLSLFSHAARRSGSSSWDLALTARERQRAAAAAKRFLRAKESGMSAWRKEIHTPPPANSSDRPTAPQLFLRRGWKGRKRSGKDRRFMRTVFEVSTPESDAGVHSARGTRRPPFLRAAGRGRPIVEVLGGRQRPTWVGGDNGFCGSRDGDGVGQAQSRSPVPISRRGRRPVGLVPRVPHEQSRLEFLVPWLNRDRKKGVPPWKKAAFPLPSTLHPHPRVPVFLLPRPNQNKRRSPECRGVDGDALPSDAPCREILPVHADPAALLTVSVVLLMLPARGVFSLPVDSNGRTKSDRLLRWSIYEAKDGMKGKRRPVGGGALVGTQGIQISQFPGGCHSSPSFLHG
ncbi:hypothetical protein MUK42_00762 [Musa troglodytarum]|uniref:Uncharacterized protein n=1 Tax=Musa troglodytarum TaxID=320322 RepID=A0A9E7FU76_9LILI|nr:hypothetical protein MUK42_00762 [Musa troglodytarum]URE01228.1 hypothetical protein MUK42_00762 [Musa troglodytarum]